MIICADDFGLSPEIDRGVDELCALGRLSAVSCLVALPRCDQVACQSLRRHEQNVDFGLHLCLTEEDGLPEGQPAPAGNLRELWTGLVFGRIPRSAIRDAITMQFQRFVEKFGRAPDFLDGHLHVHQLPIVRQAVIEFLSSLAPARRPYVRNTATDFRLLVSARLPWIKAQLVGRLGAAMRHSAMRAQLPTNSDFFGIYDLSKWSEFPRLLPRFVDCAREPNSLVVVHPGLTPGWRQTEYDALRNWTPAPGQIHRFQGAGGSARET